MIEPPDFRKLWFETFGGQTEPISYVVRCGSGPDAILDLLCIEWLLHDAELLYGQIILDNQQLTIPFERLCWELGHDSADRQWRVQSHLEISGLRQSTWSKRLPDFSLWFSHFDFGEEWRDVLAEHHELAVVSDAHRFELVLDEVPSIRLIDQGMPAPKT
ncbi:MAG: hypothetical protein AAGH92_04765 [Planctomycetota bacterium]